MKMISVLVIGILVISCLLVVDANGIFPSPLRQSKSGIALQDIKCNEGLVLIFKAITDVPACVKSTTATRLVSHGWITLEMHEAIRKNTILQNETNQFSINASNSEQNTVSACKQGYTYDTNYKQCIPIRVAEQSYCKEGYRYDAYLNQCLPIFEASAR